MVEKIASFMEENHMVKKGDHIIAGVSGGADSVCLFLVLMKLKERMGFELSILHVEHGIRGEESAADAEFVKTLANKYQIPCRVRAYQVPAIAKKEGLSLEEAGRKVRYEAFEEESFCYKEEAARRGGGVKIAVAHHSDDNAETMLFHLCRGSGVDGLAGIRPVRGKIIRPLLCVTRREIEAFLKEEKQEYRTDRTNLNIDYSRNRLRNNVMPELSAVNTQAAAHMNQTAADMAELSDYLNMQSADFIKKAVTSTPKNGLFIDTELLNPYPALLKRRILLETAAKATGGRRDITREHIKALQDICTGGVGRKISLPRGFEAEKTYNGVHIYPSDSVKNTESTSQIFGSIPSGLAGMVEPQEIFTPYGKIRCRIFQKNKKDVEIEKKTYTKWLDYDMIKNKLCFRTREVGDYFVMDTKGHRQKLKDYMINEKIPREKRSEMVLAAEGHHILWAAGGRISEYYKITEDTEKILEIQFTEERA